MKGFGWIGDLLEVFELREIVAVLSRENEALRAQRHRDLNTTGQLLKQRYELTDSLRESIRDIEKATASISQLTQLTDLLLEQIAWYRVRHMNGYAFEDYEDEMSARINHPTFRQAPDGD